MKSDAASATDPLRDGAAAGELDDAARAVGPWICRLARLGYASRGLVYVVIGLLAAMAAAGIGGRTTDMRGAISTILRQPFGRTIVAICIVGLLGHALWRLISAARDTEDRGSSAKGMAIRIGQAGSGLVAIGIAVQGWRVLSGNLGESSNAEVWTGRVLTAPAGRWLVGLAGAGILGYGIYQVYKGSRGNVTRHLNLWRVEGVWRDRIEKLARFGLAARGVVFVVIGWFLIAAAMKFAGDSARDIDGALDALGGQPYGAVVLSVVAFGLISYGLTQMVHARWRRVELE